MLEEAAERARFAAWLAAQTGARIDAAALRAARPSGGGWSNETAIVETGDATLPRVVVRVQPARMSMFPSYDLARELCCLRAVARKCRAPVPAVLAEDLEGDVFSRPRFVMRHVAGRVPSDDRPTFAEAGWLAEASPREQREFHTGLIRAIREVHRIPANAPELAALRDGREPGLQGELARLESVFAWDRGARFPAAIEAGFAFARRAQPAADSQCLLWGDARPANAIVAEDGFAVRALLDWELASLGAPELDVAWLLEMNWMRVEGAGTQPLAGFLDAAETVACYEESADTKLGDLAWYRLFSALKMAVLMHRYLRAMVHAGRLDASHRLLGETVATRRLEALAHGFA